MNTFQAIRSCAIPLLFSVGLLTGCAGFPYSQSGERTAELPAGKGVIVFKSPDWQGARRRIQYADNDQRVEYALFMGKQGGDARARAEFVYMDRPPMTLVAFEFPFNVRDKVEAWNFSKGQAIEWQEAVLTRTDLGAFYLRRYRLTALNRQCFGLLGEWDAAVDDPMLRNTRILFGYYCAPPGDSLDDTKTAALIGGLGLRQITRRPVVWGFLVYDPLTSGEIYRDIDAHASGQEDQLRAMNLAQGKDKGQGVSPPVGIPDFPFRYAKDYNVSGGDELQ
ncbi:MAG: hypothetical protein ISR51_00505 [Rhodospirillales bacterium]|nr:hypothetical protein [Alphaproteobacteria bacterium]MBL6947131.1 hypothetical protein [Rhodospirillales bacterium]